MLNVDYITIREIQRNPKKITEKVNEADMSYVVMSNNRPQFVIVSLKAFSELQRPQGKNESKNEVASLLGLINWAEKQSFDLPSDLSENHDNYLWKKSEQEK